MFNSISNNNLLNKGISKFEKSNSLTFVNIKKLALKNTFQDNHQNLNYLNKSKTIHRKTILNNTDLTKFKFKKENKKTTINFGICFALKTTYCRSGNSKSSSDKEKAFIFLDSFLKKRFDVINYFKKMDIIDRMRTLLFNYYQNLSLEFLKVPNLCDESEMKIFDLENIKHDEKTIKELGEYYSIRIKNKEIEEIDKNLLNYINPEIKKYAVSE